MDELADKLELTKLSSVPISAISGNVTIIKLLHYTLNATLPRRGKVRTRTS